MAEEGKQSKRKGRQPEQMRGGNGYISWVPRRGKWRSGQTTSEVARTRQIAKYFQAHGTWTQETVNDLRHFGRVTERLGDDEEGDGITRVHDAIHKVITLRGPELEIDEHPMMFRLRFVKQLEAILGGYYAAAEHSRYAHSLGVMHMTGRIAKALKLPPKQQATLRIAAFLHDVGHLTFSHGAEPILQRELGINHDQLGERKMRQTGIPEMLARHGIDFEEVAKLCRGEGLGKIVTEYADRMDYLQRDALNIGVKPEVKREVKLTVEELIRNLRLRGNNVCVTQEGEKTLHKFADLRRLFFTQVYFLPPSMLTRYLLRRALAKGYEKKVITLSDLTEGTDDQVGRKLNKAHIPEADYLMPARSHYAFNPIFTANFTQLRSGMKRPDKREEMKARLVRVLKRAGLKEHEFYVDHTPDVGKELRYHVLQSNGHVVEKRFKPITPDDEKIFFVAATLEKEAKARSAIKRYVNKITKEPHNQPWSWGGGNEKV